MKIHNIRNERYMPVFIADNSKIDAKSGEYSDPLMHWPLRGAAFTNEIGEALRPLIGGYATLSWAPALMYIGADVYDKYKNNSTEYSPNSERCLKQAIFQGLASIFLPLVAVKTGQNIVSNTGKLTQTKLSINAQENISKLANEFIANGKLHVYNNKDAECTKEFVDKVKNTLEYKREVKSTNPIKKVWYFMENKLSVNKEQDIEKYATETISDLIKQRKNIINPSTSFKTGNIYNKYIANLKIGQSENVAIKSTLSSYQYNKMLKGRFIKTLGGFIALGLAINPIDHFVEDVLIGKVVNTGIEKMRNKQSKG